MLRNYFKTAWRNIIGTIDYSTLNVMGFPGNKSGNSKPGEVVADRIKKHELIN